MLALDEPRTNRTIHASVETRAGGRKICDGLPADAICLAQTSMGMAA